MKIKGLKKIAGESKNLTGYYSPEYLQINFDRKTGEAWSNYHYSIGGNSWTQYHESGIVNCGTIHEPKTMREIREMIESAIMRREEEA